MIIQRVHLFATIASLAFALSGCGGTMQNQVGSTSMLMAANETSNEKAKDVRIQEVDRDKLLALIDQDLLTWEKDKNKVEGQLKKSEDNLKWAKGLTWIGGGSGGLLSIGGSAAGSAATGGAGGAIVVLALGVKSIFFYSDDVYGKTIDSCHKYLKVYEKEVPKIGVQRFEVVGNFTDESQKQLQATYLSIWTALSDAHTGCLY